jgi:hypothetical protein
MGAIVGAIGLPHNPNFPALVASTGARCGTAQSYSRAASDLAALRPPFNGLMQKTASKISYRAIRQRMS